MLNGIQLKYVFACLWMIMLGKCAWCQPGMGEMGVVYTTYSVTAVSDTNALFFIRDINISGNEKTKPATILRELPFKPGEAYTLAIIAQKFKTARRQLMNTGLFRDAVISLKNIESRDIFINVEVQEKWYIWPVAFFKPVDKSFGQWWHEKDRNMDRINYGVRLSHNNITGRNDKLRFSVMNGYTRQVSVQYFGLWLDPDLKWSTNAGVTYVQNREVNYMTLRNKQILVKGNRDFLHSYVGGFFQLNYRPAIKTIHTFGIGYTYESIADTIYKLNPRYSTGAKFISYPELFYRMNYYDVDFIPYPSKGFMSEITFNRKGLGIQSPVNLWEVTAKASQFWQLNSKYSVNLKALGSVKLPFSQPYSAKQFIGYNGKFLQGYEYYVIDGVAGAYTKATLSRPVFSTRLRMPSQKIKSLSKIPIKLYAKTFANAGYIYNTSTGQNMFTNRFLYSGGLGVDLVTYNDFVIKIEWSFNRLGENGVYLHQRNDF